MGYFSSGFIRDYYYNYETNKALESLNAYYDTQTALQTDAYKVAKYGMTFKDKKDYQIRLKCFQKATQLDPEWRDGWIWRGYTELGLNAPKDALLSLKKAESIDPIYPFTYKLLSIAYRETGDDSSANFAQEKLGYLSKTYK